MQVRLGRVLSLNTHHSTFAYAHDSARNAGDAASASGCGISLKIKRVVLVDFIHVIPLHAKEYHISYVYVMLMFMIYLFKNR